MKIPSNITSGDSVSWKDDSTIDNLGNEISSSEWTLNYSIRGPGQLDLVAVADGSGWKTSISSVQSSGLDSGDYYWQAFATKGSERVTLGSGQLKIGANFSDQSIGFDGRSQSQKDLDAVKAAIRTIISGGAVQKYTIGTRSLEKMPMADLLMLESRLKAEVAREQRAEMIRGGQGSPFTLKVRF